MPRNLTDRFPANLEKEEDEDESVQIRRTDGLRVRDAPPTGIVDRLPPVKKTAAKVRTVKKRESFAEVVDETFTPDPHMPLALDLSDPNQDYNAIALKHLDSIGNGIAAGFQATILRAQEGLNDAFSWIYANEFPKVQGDQRTAQQQVERTALQQRFIKDSMDARQQLDELVNNPDDPILQRASRDMTRFMLPYLLFRKAAGGGPVRQNLVAAPLADIAAFADDEGRLSSLVVEADIPGLSDAVQKYLATDPDDTKAQAIFKQYLEGVITGVASDATLLVLGKVWARARALRPRKNSEAAGVTPDTEALPGAKRTGSILEEADSKAATVAEELLSAKVKLRPGDDPAEVITNQFRDKLRETGVWDVFEKPDQDAKLLWMFKRAQDTFGPGGSLKAPPVKPTTAAGNQWEDQWEFNIAKGKEIKRKQSKVTPKKVLETLETAIVDRSGPFRRMLEKDPLGQRAAELFALTRGASTKAALVNKEAVRAIYQEKVPGLPVWRAVSREKRGLVDKAITIRRFRQIKSYKPGWSEKGNPLSRGSTEFFDGRLKAMREELGEAEYADVMKRADQFFTSMRRSLDELLDGGVISNEEYTALARFQFSPIKYIEELDKPIAQFTDPSGKPISVSSSGIQPLGKGAQKTIETDTEIFLQEVIVRATTKAMKNRANLALREAAKSEQLPGIKIKVPKGENKKDWTEITVMEDGKPKKMHLLREYAPMWAANPEEMGKMWRNLGYATGAPIVRLGATGPLNPEFAISNFPRDMAYNILVSNQYSGFLPKALKQWGEDFADVWDDAVFQRGTYKEYINEGGGMEFLTHQGIPGHAKPAHTVLKDWEDAFAYTNTTSEIINRLTTRARTLKNIQKANGPDYILTQADKEHATFVARTTLDFDQGGTAAKATNEIIPYLNASVQGMRGYARSFKTNPTKASLYAAQLLGIYGSVDLASRAINPEAHAAIPEYVSSLYMTVTTPWSFVDDQGDTRFMYFKFPIDHSTTGLKVFADSMTRAAMNEGLPSEKKVDSIRDFSSFMSSQFGIVPGATMPPVIGGLIAYGANFDWWRQAPAWMGEQGIPARMEFTEETPVFFRDLAEAAEGTADISPARMSAAISQVVPENIFTNLLGAGYRAATTGIERDMLEPMEKELIQQLREFPGSRRFIGITSPHGRFADEIREVGAEARGEQVQVTRQVDAFSERIVKGVEGVTMESATNWIQQEVPFEQQTQAVERLVNNIALEKVFEGIKYQENRIYLPTRRWWKQVSAQPPAARAKLLVEHISAMQNIDGDEQRKSAKQIIGAVMGTVPGFNPKTSPEFAMGLKRELELQGIPPNEFFK